MEIIDSVLKEGRTTLTEYESKQVLASYGLPVTREVLVDKLEDLLKAAEIGEKAGLNYIYAGNLPGRVGKWEDTSCPNCDNVKMPHRVCPHCGHYKSKEILEVTEE